MKYLKKIFEYQKDSEREIIEDYFLDMIDDRICRSSQEEGIQFLNIETASSVIIMFEFGLMGIKWPVEHFYKNGLIPNTKVRKIDLTSINKVDFLNKFDQFLSLCEEFGMIKNIVNLGDDYWIEDTDPDSLRSRYILRRIKTILTKLERAGYDLEFQCDFNDVFKNWIERPFGFSNCYVAVHSKNKKKNK